jgi:hypothetical protein
MQCSALCVPSGTLRLCSLYADLSNDAAVHAACRYCSKACQVEHWGTVKWAQHKKVCKRIQAAAGSS